MLGLLIHKKSSVNKLINLLIDQLLFGAKNRSGEKIKRLIRDPLFLELRESGCSANLEPHTNWNKLSEPNPSCAISETFLLKSSHEKRKNTVSGT